MQEKEKKKYEDTSRSTAVGASYLFIFKKIKKKYMRTHRGVPRWVPP
jgi:hypothetical protein